MSFFSKLQSSIQRFFYGRNGIDILSRDMNILALILMVLDAIFNTYVIYLIGLVIFGLALYRMCSRKIAKRQAENRKYSAYRAIVIGWFKSKGQPSADKKNYHYYSCSSCKQKLRVPRGRGKIEITCPKCGLKFIKKT